MSLQVAKWGNSLAVRLPAALVRQAGWKAGDEIEARLTSSGSLTLAPVPQVAPSSVRAGLGLLANRKRSPIARDDPDAGLLRAVRTDDRRTRRAKIAR
jgi:antitoxin component of MazEF toxin-antitoxin module